MKLSALDLWVREQEGLDVLTREELEGIQLKKLNRLLEREKKRGGFYQDLPGHLSDLSELSGLPFTTEADLKEQGHRMVLLSQSKVDGSVQRRLPVLPGRQRGSIIQLRTMRGPFLFLQRDFQSWCIRERRR